MRSVARSRPGRLIELANLGYDRSVREVLNVRLPCNELAPTAVRAKMRSIPGLGSALGDAMLVTSELVTNAVRHSLCAEDDFLSVRILRDGGLRISVLDPGGSGKAAQIAHRPTELGGLGLKVVEKLATTWGTERRNDGYRVWAELPLPRSGVAQCHPAASQGRLEEVQQDRA